jgi:hypothetical protein
MGPKNLAFFVARASTFACRNSRRSIVRRTRTVVAPVEQGPPRNSPLVFGSWDECLLWIELCGVWLPVRTGRSSTGGGEPSANADLKWAAHS